MATPSNGAVVVVTGGASGIGRAMVDSFRRRGAKLVIADIDEAAAERAAEELRAEGAIALAAKVDVSSAGSVQALADTSFAHFGRVDVLCNNAGVSMRPYRASWNASISDYAWLMGVNYFGVVHGILSFVPRMRQQTGHKHVVNTSSVTALDIAPGHAPYAATKAAIATLSDALRYELRDHGDDFGVTVVYPGLVTTEIATSERFRPSEESSSTRDVIEYTPARAAGLNYNVPILPALVGEMIVDAIESGVDSVHTHGFPTDLVAERLAVTRGSTPSPDQHESPTG